MNKKRIAFINQRYGAEVNGGSEQYTREFAERLTAAYDVEVLTTCALDYTTWEDYFPEGTVQLNGVTVRRFAVDAPRDTERFSAVHARIVESIGDDAYEEQWIDEQGPLCTKLVQYIAEHKDDYDVFIFITYLYYLTVKGIGLVKDKAILVPTAHDELPIRLHVYRDVFAAPRAYGFNAPEEQEFVYSMFHTEDIPFEMLGLGVDLPGDVDAGRFRKKYGYDKFLLYAGRIDESKGCGQLFDYFTAYKQRNPESSLKLLLMGKAVMDVPQHPDIIPLGFVSEQDKYDGMAAAELFILASQFESLSIVVLESLAVGVPVLVNGECEVLKGHCIRSNAGLYYQNYYEFEGAVHYLLSHQKIYHAMGENGKAYVTQNYTWPVVTEKLVRLIESV